MTPAECDGAAGTSPPGADGGPAGVAERRIRLEMQRASRLVADLELEQRAIAESTAQGPDDEHDAEGSTVGFERARVGALLGAARRHLRELGEAGERVRDGTWGTCRHCGGVIPAERLAALAATTSCVVCAARHHGAGS